jgi:hypothetical protein
VQTEESPRSPRRAGSWRATECAVNQPLTEHNYSHGTISDFILDCTTRTEVSPLTTGSWCLSRARGCKEALTQSKRQPWPLFRCCASQFSCEGPCTFASIYTPPRPPYSDFPPLANQAVPPPLRQPPSTSSTHLPSSQRRLSRLSPVLSLRPRFYSRFPFSRNSLCD